jgi:hypothetical protein
VLSSRKSAGDFTKMHPVFIQSKVQDESKYLMKTSNLISMCVYVYPFILSALFLLCFTDLRLLL